MFICDTWVSSAPEELGQQGDGVVQGAEQDGHRGQGTLGSKEDTKLSLAWYMSDWAGQEAKTWFQAQGQIISLALKAMKLLVGELWRRKCLDTT